MKAVAPILFMGVLLASSVSVTVVGEAWAEEHILEQHEIKIDGMT